MAKECILLTYHVGEYFHLRYQPLVLSANSDWSSIDPDDLRSLPLPFSFSDLSKTKQTGLSCTDHVSSQSLTSQFGKYTYRPASCVAWCSQPNVPMEMSSPQDDSFSPDKGNPTNDRVQETVMTKRSFNLQSLQLAFGTAWKGQGVFG